MVVGLMSQEGIRWKDVVGRLRTTKSRRWVEQRWVGRKPAPSRRPPQATLPSADHTAEIARLQQENERLRMECDILNTARDYCWSSDMRFRFIEDRRVDHPVRNTDRSSALLFAPNGQVCQYYLWPI
jgi:transposase-like protein